MQYGVTQEMIDRYKQIVFEKSVNVQVRRGDPVRRRDWDGVEEQRELQGLTDAQIAAQLHLMEQQVTFIRIDAERERYTLDAHAMLYRLEGNRGKHVNSYAATRQAADLALTSATSRRSTSITSEELMPQMSGMVIGGRLQQHQRMTEHEVRAGI